MSTVSWRGEEVLRRGGLTTGYYRTVSGSFGLQFGASSCSKAIFFMTPTALDYLERSEGLEVGGDVGAPWRTSGPAGTSTARPSRPRSSPARSASRG